MSQRVSMWVDPAFRKAVKKKAADADKDVVSFTREFAEQLEEFPPKKKNDKKIGFF